MLDPHARPPNFIRQFYKNIHKLKTSNIVSLDNRDICDFVHNKEDALERFIEKEESLDSQETIDAFDKFLYHDLKGVVDHNIQEHGKRGRDEKTGESTCRPEELELKIYESKDLPGTRYHIFITIL